MASGRPNARPMHLDDQHQRRIERDCREPHPRAHAPAKQPREQILHRRDAAACARQHERGDVRRPHRDVEERRRTGQRRRSARRTRSEKPSAIDGDGPRDAERDREEQRNFGLPRIALRLPLPERRRSSRYASDWNTAIASRPPRRSPVVPSPILFITYARQTRASASTITNEPPQPPQKPCADSGPSGNASLVRP